MKHKIRSSKKLLILTILFLSFLSLWRFNIDFFNVKETINDSNCKDEEIVKKKNIKGIVVRKYTKRGYKYFEYANNGDTLTSDWGLLKDEFYDLIKIGDKIEKRSGSLKFVLHSMETDTATIIDFDCQ
jgi:hypothetical protein